MLPLAGLRIISVEQYGAGPFGTQTLADLGAELIKIENPHDGGDVSRMGQPHFIEGVDETNASLFFQALNRNKRSLTLDLAREEGQAVLRDLARTADGLACNLRGDVPGKLGLTYESLGAVNPKIVCAHLTAYGRDGSRAAWPGYDYLMQAETGYLTVTGEPGTPPARMGLSIVDFMTGLNMALGLLAAVLKARETGVGRDIDVSLFDTALFNLNYLAAWNLATGQNQGREPRSAHPVITPCQLYRTRDGWIFIMCNKEKFWGVLCRAVGRPEWADDPRFRSYPERLANRALITELLDEVLMARTSAEWIDAFGGKVPAAPVLDVAQALANPFVMEGGRIQTLTEEKSGQDFRLLAQPIRTVGEEPPNRPAPVLGGDTESILEGLGYDAAHIAGLRRAGVI